MVFVSQELFDEAVRLEEAGQKERALVIWRSLAELTPTCNAFLRLGSVARQLGLIDEAERAFKRALEIDGRSALALQVLGTMALGRQDYSAAIDYLKRSCEIEETPGALTILGVVLGRDGNDAEAEEVYRRAIRIEPEYEGAYYNLAVLLRQNGRPSEAQPLLRRAIELDPVYAVAHRELGFVLMKSREGEAHIRKAIELTPDDCWAHIYLGTYLFGSDAGAAEAEFRIAAKLEPDWSAPLWSLGNLFESKDIDLAQSFFEQALAVDPDNWNALRGLARVFAKRGQIDLAREYITRALEQYPRHERSLEFLGELDRARVG
jgi:protein O-GlcNAc transferase